MIQVLNDATIVTVYKSELYALYYCIIDFSISFRKDFDYYIYNKLKPKKFSLFYLILPVLFT